MSWVDVLVSTWLRSIQALGRFLLDGMSCMYVAEMSAVRQYSHGPEDLLTAEKHDFA